MNRKGMFPRRVLLAGLTFNGIAYTSIRIGGDPLIQGGLIALGTLLIVVPVAWWWRRSRYGIVAMKNRSAHRDERNNGFVTIWDRLNHSSKWAMRRRWGKEIRPDLFGAAWGIQLWWLLWKVSVREYAVNLGKDNYGGLWLQHNAVVTMIGSARTGKTSAMCCRLIDHRGPAIVTSIRKDVVVHTAQLRARVGQLYFFNPGNVGNLPSNLKWSVLHGCTTMDTAIRRATQLIGEATSSEERQYWSDQAHRILAPMMYAAAHAELPMRAVQRWVAATGEDAHKAKTDIIAILENTPEGKSQVDNMRQFFGMVGPGDRTRLSITNTIAQVLSWLGNPRVAALGDSRGEDLFDIKRDLIGTNATLYILGAENRGTSALTGCLVAEIIYQSTQHAETLDGGRLSPPLLGLLDEVTATCPGRPVPTWATFLGGSGIPLHIGVQSRSRLDEVWGEEGRKTILNMSSVVMVGAGCMDPQELRDYSLMAGDREVPQRDKDGKVIKDAPRRDVPVLSVKDIKNLAIGQWIAYLRGPVTKINTENIKERKDVKKAGGYRPPAAAETNFEEAARREMREEQMQGERK